MSRQEAEMEMKATDLERFFSASSALLFLLDREGVIFFISDSATRYLGDKAEGLIGRQLDETDLPPGLYLLFTEKNQLVQKTGRSERGMLQLPLILGERWFEYDISPVFDDRGEVMGTVATVQDITERKRAEEELRESEERARRRAEELDKLMDIVPAGILVAHDPESRIMTGNRMALYLHEHEEGEYLSAGTVQGEVLDSRRHFIKDGRELKPEELPIQMAATGKEVRDFEVDCLYPSGRRVTFVESAVPLLDDNGRVRGAVGVYFDITERKKAEEEVKASKYMLQLVLDNIPDRVFWKDRDLIYLGANRTAARDAGLSDPKEILGKNDRELAWKESAELYRADDRAVIDSGQPKLNFEEPQVGSDGRTRWLSTSKLPLRDSTDRIIGVLGMYEDITERKRAEEALEEAKTAAELYLDLLTHDINNYNAAAMGYLQLAVERIPFEEKDRNLIAKSLEELRASTNLIENIRDIQKVETGEVKVERIDLCLMLEEIKSEYENPPGRDVTITLEVSDHRSVVVSSLLRDAFSNIIGNAVKHSTGPLRIDIALNPESIGGKEYMRVSVEDNGPGIPEDVKKKLFTRSVRGLTEAAGHGLGLYLVKRLVEDQGGEVWVEDRLPGDYSKGARFVVLLPAAM